MATTQTTKNFDHYRGDTWDGFTCTGLVVNGAPPVSPLASVRIQLRITGGLRTAPADLEITSAAGITITDAANAAFVVQPRVIDLAGGYYGYDVELTFANGRVKTYQTGYFNITEDKSHG